MKLIRNTESQSFQTPNALVTPMATPRLGSDQISVIRQKMGNGKSNPTHTQTSEEVMVMLSGTVTVTVDKEIVSLSAGDTLIVPAEVPHSIENTSGGESEWLIISPVGMQFKGPTGELMTPEWAL